MEDCYITGSHGFIGSCLVKRLNNFVAIPHSKISRIKLKPYKRFFFLSAYGNLAEHTDTDAIIKANITDLLRILNQTNFENGLASFVFISTSSVMRKIQTMYSRTKRAAEEILLAYMEKYNAPICVVRPFSITGVGEQPNHLIPTLIRSCLLKEETPFVPEPVHDYIDVEDVVEGILAFSSRHAKGIFELGTGVSYTNDQVRLLVEEITGKKANYHLVKNLRAYDSRDWVSRNFAARTFGWNPQKPLQKSIEEMVQKFVEGLTI